MGSTSLQHHHLGPLLGEENIPQLLPGQAQAHEGAQIVPVGETGPRRVSTSRGAQRALLPLLPGLLLQPVGEKGPQPSLGVGIASR